MPNVLVKLENIDKTYGEGNTSTHALKGIDLEIYEGELLMIVGPSGSGKTTLISIIAGILDPSSGTCKVLDQDMSLMHNGEKTTFRGKNIGFVFQAFNLVPMLSSIENIAIPLIINGMEYDQAVDEAQKMLQIMGMEEKIYSYPPELSGGQQQRVAIARSCIHNPKIIVCDEPTSALDHETGMKVLDLLKKRALEPGRALIVVTHDARIFSFADRIVRMDDGKIAEIKLNQAESSQNSLGHENS
jgi:putative ABC transport system ATP-binding protein